MKNWSREIFNKSFVFKYRSILLLKLTKIKQYKHPHICPFKFVWFVLKTFTRFEMKKKTTQNIIRDLPILTTSIHIFTKPFQLKIPWFHPFQLFVQCRSDFKTTFMSHNTLAYSYRKEEDERSTRSLLVIFGEKAKRVIQQVF